VKRVVFAAIAACIAQGFAAAAAAQEAAAQEVTTEARPDTGGSEPPGPVDIIVRGRRLGDLRTEIEHAEEALFARFNDINSTDEFDIRCHSDRYGYMRRRVCQSNVMRKLLGQIGSAQARGFQGRGSPGAAALFAEEANRKERLLNEEMRRLASEDDQLQQALTHLAQAQSDLVLRRGTTTLSREVTALFGQLPQGADLMFEVVIGNQPWTHRLRERTFTIADVSGEIRRLHVDCAEGSRQIDYETGVDWTVPSDWTSCAVQVNAKRETTFRLYEF
jgi:hypothetical protein